MGDDSRYKEFYLKEKQQFQDWCHANSNLSVDEIKDLYQTSQVYLYENILHRRVVLSSSLKTYLYGIAKNQMSTKYRKELVLTKHESAVMEHVKFLATLDPNDQNHARVTAIKRAIASIKEPCRSILKLFYYDSLSIKEIATRLAYKNDQVVKTQKNRCIEHLRKHYEKGGNDA